MQEAPKVKCIYHDAHATAALGGSRTLRAPYHTAKGLRDSLWQALQGLAGNVERQVPPMC